MDDMDIQIDPIYYCLAALFAIVAFVYGWWRYPYTLSRWKRNRMSTISFLEDRLAYAIALAIFWGGLILYGGCSNDEDNTQKEISKEHIVEQIKDV